MASRNEINSNFYQLVDVDANGTVTGIKSEYLPNVANATAAGSNTEVQFNLNGNLAATATFTFNPDTEVLTALYLSGNGTGIINVLGENIVGTVANATYATNAGNVEYANTSGTATYAVTAGNATHATSSDTSLVAYLVSGANVSGTVANATYATSAGSADSVSGANVSGAVANATYATSAGSADSVSGSNVVGAVANATYATSAGTADSVSGANVSGTVANATYATSAGSATSATTAGTVTTASQPNITSVGTLTSLTTSGDATIGGNLNVNGNTQYINVVDLVVQDPIIEQGNGPNNTPLTTNDGKDRGQVLHYYTTQPVDAFMGWDNSGGEFIFGSNVSVSNNIITVNSYGNIHASNVIANISASNVVGAVANATHATTSDSANSVSGSNVVGAVANATYAVTAGSVTSATTAGTVTTAAQPNITSTGTLTGLTVNGTGNIANITMQNLGSGISKITVPASGQLQIQSNLAVVGSNFFTVNLNNSNQNGDVTLIGNVKINESGSSGANCITTLGNVQNIRIPGGTSNQVLTTNGSGNLSWSTVNNVANATHATTSDSANSVSGANVVGDVSGANHANIADSANSVAGANVVGDVASAITAYSVDLANVVGIGNIAGINLDGNVGNVLAGDGTWIAAGGGGSPAGNIYELQFNDNGVFGADGNFYVDTSVGSLTAQYIVGATTIQSPQANISNVNAGSSPYSPDVMLRGNYTTDINSNGYYRGNLTFSSSFTPGDGSFPTNTVTISILPNPNFSDVDGSGVALYGNYTLNLPLTVGNASEVLSTDGTGNLSWVAQPSVGNIATINLDGNVGNVLAGDGTWIAAGGGGNINNNVFTTELYPNVDTKLHIRSEIDVANGASDATSFLSFDEGSNVANAIAKIQGRYIDFHANNAIRFYTNEGIEMASVDPFTTAQSINMQGNIKFNEAWVPGFLGTVELGNVSNLKIIGGNASEVLSTDGTGNLSWVAQPIVGNIAGINLDGNVGNVLAGDGTWIAAGGGGTPGGSNTELQFNNAGSFGGSANLTFNNTTNTLSATNITVSNISITKYNETNVSGGNVSGTITPDVSTGTIFNYTLTGNITLNNLTNAVAGSSATIILTQDGTGSRILTSTMKFLGGYKTLSTTANSIDILSVFYDGTTYYASLGQGFA